jgi:hypothetical protein
MRSEADQLFSPITLDSWSGSGLELQYVYSNPFEIRLEGFLIPVDFGPCLANLIPFVMRISLLVTTGKQ